MTYDYTKAAATALRLLTYFGAPVTISRETVGTYDPQQGRAPKSTSSWTAKAVRGDAYTLQEIDGTLIQAGDLRLLVSAEAGRDLQTGDLITVESDVWRVVKPNPMRPATVTVMYVAQLRK